MGKTFPFLFCPPCGGAEGIQLREGSSVRGWRQPNVVWGRAPLRYFGLWLAGRGSRAAGERVKRDSVHSTTTKLSASAVTDVGAFGDLVFLENEHKQTTTASTLESLPEIRHRASCEDVARGIGDVDE